MELSARDTFFEFERRCFDIRAYLRHIRTKIEVTETEIDHLNSQLHDYGVELIPKPTTDRHRHGSRYSVDEIAQLIEPIGQVLTAVWKRAYEFSGRGTLAISGLTNTWDETSEEWIQEAERMMADLVPSSSDYAAVLKTMEERLEQLEPDAKPIEIPLVVGYAFARRMHQAANSLHFLHTEISTLRWSAISQNADEDTNIFRQSFILLMTHFEATVVDLVRKAMEVNFFELASFFGGKGKLAFSQFADSGDFLSFRTTVVEGLLNERYVKELLIELRRLDVIIPDVEDAFPRVIEFVLRRNVHLHNRGIVDGRYLEKNSAGKELWNLDKLKIGDRASITEKYLDRALWLCQRYVEAVAAWVDAGAKVP